jgi:hypothetical protein
MASSAPDLVADGARYRVALARRRVPVMSGCTVVAVEGERQAQVAVVAELDAAGQPIRGTERRLQADAVCLGLGFTPSNEISRALGCRHRVDSSTLGLRAIVDGNGRTTVENVWVIGDAGGIEGARVAQALGVLAGVDVTRTLSGVVDAGLAAELRDAHGAVRRNRQFQRALSQLYRAPAIVDQLATESTLVCRCEHVSLGDVDAALAGGAAHTGAVKRITRAGMGPCQGRYCAAVIATLAARRADRPVDEFSGFAPTPPFRPVSVELLAADAASGPPAT